MWRLNHGFGISDVAIMSQTYKRTNVIGDGRSGNFIMVRKGPHVAILIETSTAYGRGLLRGVGEYLKFHPTWSVYVDERALGDPVPPWLENWRGDGILIRDSGNTSMAVAKTSCASIVNLGEKIVEDIPLICSDDEIIADQIVEHLTQRGFRNFGYVGFSDRCFSKSRGDHFSRAIAVQEGTTFASFEFSNETAESTWEASQDHLAEWLLGLPKPVGVMACYDVVGFRVIDASRRAGLSVPDEIAVVGVDNDAELCALSNPPLSSVEHRAEYIGSTAVEILNVLMIGGPRPKPITTVRPNGIVTRQSSDIIAIEDDKVAAACCYMRQHACEGITVPEVSEHVSLSRRALERRFHNALRRSPQSELRRIQIDQVRRLLEDTDYKLSTIAKMSGFRYHEYMSKVFKEKTGLSPGIYRKSKRQQAQKASAEQSLVKK